MPKLCDMLVRCLSLLDLCAYCASEGAHFDAEWKDKFKTVLPICVPCGLSKQPICQRLLGGKNTPNDVQQHVHLLR